MHKTCIHFLVDFLLLALPFLNRKTLRITSCTQSCTLNREIHMLLKHLVGKHLRFPDCCLFFSATHCTLPGCCQQNKTVSYIYAVCLFFKKFALSLNMTSEDVCVFQNWKTTRSLLQVWTCLYGNDCFWVASLSAFVILPCLCPSILNKEIHAITSISLTVTGCMFYLLLDMYSVGFAPFSPMLVQCHITQPTNYLIVVGGESLPEKTRGTSSSTLSVQVRGKY